MKKSVSYFLILNLFFSIVAFGFIFNIDFIRGEYASKGDGSEYAIGTKSNKVKPPEVTTLPVGASALVKSKATIQLAGGTTGTVISKGGKYYLVQEGVVSETPLAKSAIEGATVEGFSSSAGVAGHLWQGLYWSAIVVMGIQLFGGLLTDDQALIDSLSKAAVGGIMAGNLLVGGMEQFHSATWGSQAAFSGWTNLQVYGYGAGIVVAAIIFYNTYVKEDTETKTFTCEPWQAPTGGSNCEKCNKQGALPCSEYQCRSLGQSCQLLNPGTGEESCTWVNRNDVNPPVMKPLNDALLNNYIYSPDNTISPPDKGVKVKNNELASGCAEAFTPLTFGITTNEPAQCKVSILREDNFEKMNLYFGNSNSFTYNHSQIMVLPGAEALEAEGLKLQNNGNFEVYARCQDANGNANTANFVFKYCVEKGPDTTPPLIVSTNLLNNMPIAFDQSSIDLEIYTNEPADCKWDYLDKDYENMDNSFTCSKNIFQMNVQMLYPCTTTLTGLKNEFENKFYFRCKDLSENVNAESQPKEGFILLGTKPLVIDFISPNEETIKDSTDIVQVVLEVETSAGYSDGESACYYSDTGTEGSYILFGNTNSYQHTQELWFNTGTYEYFIKCLDLGGNTDETTINFDVETDSLSPLVVRVYHEDKYLKLLTNEEAECVYDTTSCSYTFEDGIKMNNIDETSHYTDWDTAVNFYIKCKDAYGNKPFPDKCNLIAKPSQIF